MDQKMISDLDLFNVEFNRLLEEKNQVQLLTLIKQKHIKEIELDRLVEDKKIDLFIWQALLTRQLTKDKIIKTSLDSKYNQYYRQIKQLKTIKELQNLEIEMFKTYLNWMIYEVEVTQNHALNRILRCIHINLDGNLTLERIAHQVSLSKSYVSQVFQKGMKMTVMEYVYLKKIERAKMYLSTTNMSIMEVAQILGFYDSSHFSRIFKGIEGISPSHFRKLK